MYYITPESETIARSSIWKNAGAKRRRFSFYLLNALEVEKILEEIADGTKQAVATVAITVAVG